MRESTGPVPPMTTGRVPQTVTGSIPIPVRLHRETSGSGLRRALLVHGLSSDSGGWWRLAAHLEAAGWSVTTVDLRGHGRSPRAAAYPVVGYAADLLGVWPEPRTPWDLVVGHSLGGTSSVIAAAGEPGWTRMLVLVDPVLAIDGAGLDLLTTRITAELEVAAGLDDDSLAARIAADNPRWAPQDVTAKVGALRRVEKATIRATTAQPGGWQAARYAREVQVPTLLIGADEEQGALLDRQLAAGIADENPMVRATSIVGAGHSVHRDSPDAFLFTLTAFVEGGGA